MPKIFSRMCLKCVLIFLTHLIDEKFYCKSAKMKLIGIRWIPPVAILLMLEEGPEAGGLPRAPLVRKRAETTIWDMFPNFKPPAHCASLFATRSLPIRIRYFESIFGYGMGWGKPLLRVRSGLLTCPSSIAYSCNSPLEYKANHL